jgi:hypothetical protein
MKPALKLVGSSRTRSRPLLRVVLIEARVGSLRNGERSSARIE